MTRLSDIMCNFVLSELIRFEKWMDRLMDGWMTVRTDKQVNELMDGRQMDMDKLSQMDKWMSRLIEDFVDIRY